MKKIYAITNDEIFIKTRLILLEIPTLTLTETRLIDYILSYQNVNPKFGCTQSYKTIGQLLRLKSTTVANVVSELRNKGIVYGDFKTNYDKTSGRGGSSNNLLIKIEEINRLLTEVENNIKMGEIKEIEDKLARIELQKNTLPEEKISTQTTIQHNIENKFIPSIDIDESSSENIEKPKIKKLSVDEFIKKVIYKWGSYVSEEKIKGLKSLIEESLQLETDNIYDLTKDDIKFLNESLEYKNDKNEYKFIKLI